MCLHVFMKHEHLQCLFNLYECNRKFTQDLDNRESVLCIITDSKIWCEVLLLI